MFLPSMVTHKPPPEEQREETPEEQGCSISALRKNATGQVTLSFQQPETPESSNNSESQASVSPPVKYISPEQFRGYPKAGVRTSSRKPREKGRSRIITDTPEKLLLEEKHKRKIENRSGNTKVLIIKKRLFVKQKVVPESGSEDEICLNDGDISELDEEESSTLQEPESGHFFLVKFTSNKSVVHYVGRIVKKCDDGDFEVSFLRKSQEVENNFFYPAVEDISSVQMCDIVKVLPLPQEHGKTKRQQSLLSFPISFVQYNILMNEASDIQGYCDLNFLAFALRLRENSEKPQPGNSTRLGIKPKTNEKMGSNEVASFFHHYVTTILDPGVKHLEIFCNSGERQNKNYTLFRYIHYLVHKLNRFESVHVTFPVRRHVYLECDKDMGLIKNKLKAELP
ncbi:hypothetical protein ANN_18742 [Periplaneta americana]|uniref:Uncharacterized protein n=1 Tax=Periplaneta americana TaxID=6978 RepID=A0ABQ8SQX1_PERAM|nr:hypothetical protein ANN_18742 [Periplaneta americana]